jgi:CheY-like chemotaxis protein
VVEDDSGIREVIAECLEGEGYRVEAAGNGLEGLDQVRERRPDVIILDLIMPGMGGGQFLERLRSDVGLRDIPVVLMTGATPSPTRPLPPADALLTKPFELDDLIGAIRRLQTTASVPQESR